MTKRKSARGGGSRGKGKQSTGDRVPHPVAENEDPPEEEEEEEEEAGPEEAEETEEKDAPSAGAGRKRAGRGGGRHSTPADCGYRSRLGLVCST